ncbi:MAG: hypothetical protein JWR55_981 [Aeromicrobium sp.]|jgi:hypothetical protein|nr:hypothetical protein [Aeromicrobium sp.]
MTTRMAPAQVVQAVAVQSVGRRVSSVALAAATVIGVWVGVNAPEVSPVSQPQTVAVQQPGTN